MQDGDGVAQCCHFRRGERARRRGRVNGAVVGQVAEMVFFFCRVQDLPEQKEQGEDAKDGGEQAEPARPVAFDCVEEQAAEDEKEGAAEDGFGVFVALHG